MHPNLVKAFEEERARQMEERLLKRRAAAEERRAAAEERRAAAEERRAVGSHSRADHKCVDEPSTEQSVDKHAEPYQNAVRHVDSPHSPRAAPSAVPVTRRSLTRAQEESGKRQRMEDRLAAALETKKKRAEAQRDEDAVRSALRGCYSLRGSGPLAEDAVRSALGGCYSLRGSGPPPISPPRFPSPTRATPASFASPSSKGSTESPRKFGKKGAGTALSEHPLGYPCELRGDAESVAVWGLARRLKTKGDAHATAYGWTMCHKMRRQHPSTGDIYILPPESCLTTSNLWGKRFKEECIRSFQGLLYVLKARLAKRAVRWRRVLPPNPPSILLPPIFHHMGTLPCTLPVSPM